MAAADNQYHATGRRKDAVARVYMKPGAGKITVNGKDFENYFCVPLSQSIVKQPLELTETAEKFDISMNIKGGGFNGQSGAARLGIARALLKFDPELRGKLKKAGYLTRDAREVERKKYGLSGARKRYQYSKR